MFNQVKNLSFILFIIFISNGAFSRNDDLKVPDKIKAKFNYLSIALPKMEDSKLNNSFNLIYETYKNNIELNISSIDSLIGELNHFYKTVKQSNQEKIEFLPVIAQLDSLILHLRYQKDLTLLKSSKSGRPLLENGVNNHELEIKKYNRTKQEISKKLPRKNDRVTKLDLDRPLNIKSNVIGSAFVAKKLDTDKLNYKQAATTNKKLIKKAIEPTNYDNPSRIPQNISGDKVKKVHTSWSARQDNNSKFSTSKIWQFFYKNIWVPILFAVLVALFLGFKFYQKVVPMITSIFSKEEDEIELLTIENKEEKSVKNIAPREINQDNDVSIFPVYAFNEQGELVFSNSASKMLAKKINNVKKVNTLEVKNSYFKIISMLRKDKLTDQQIFKFENNFYTYQTEYKYINGARLKVISFVPYFRSKDERFEQYKNKSFWLNELKEVDQNNNIYNLDDFLGNTLMGIHMIFEMNNVSLDYQGNPHKEIFIGLAKKDLERIFTGFMFSLSKIIKNEMESGEIILSTDNVSDRLFFKVLIPDLKIDERVMSHRIKIQNKEYEGIYAYFYELQDRFSKLGVQININHLVGEANKVEGSLITLSLQTHKETSVGRPRRKTSIETNMVN